MYFGRSESTTNGDFDCGYEMEKEIEEGKPIIVVLEYIIINKQKDRLHYEPNSREILLTCCLLLSSATYYASDSVVSFLIIS